MKSADILFRQGRVLEVAGMLVESRRDHDGAPVTLETLTAAWSSYRAAQAAEQRESGPLCPQEAYQRTRQTATARLSAHACLRTIRAPRLRLVSY